VFKQEALILGSHALLTLVMADLLVLAGFKPNAMTLNKPRHAL
jgi:hypothetical protein